MNSSGHLHHFRFEDRLEVDGLFQELIRDRWCKKQHKPWQPDADVIESFDHVEVILDIPGMDPNHLAVALNGNVLAVSGRREEKRGREIFKPRCERLIGPFMRTIALNSHVRFGAMSVEYQNGVLRIEIKKTSNRSAKVAPPENGSA
jgi:HSP20 family protein